MAIEKVSEKYELLIRYNEDGKIGAHLQNITNIKEDGILISVPKLDDPQQLTLEQLKNIVSAMSEDDWYVPPAPEETNE